MDYVLPKHVTEFMKEKDAFKKEVQKLEITNDILRKNVRDLEIMLRDLEITNDILRTNVRDSEIMLRDARIRIKELTT